MQNFFQFIMYFVFGKHWLLFDLKHGYKATLFMNELELDMHREKLQAVSKAKEKMQEEVEALGARPDLTEEEYLALYTGEEVLTPKGIYDHKKKIDGERAEEITTLKNRIKQMDDEIANADRELQKGYAMTYNNRVKYDFIRRYKVKKTFADDNK